MPKTGLLAGISLALLLVAMWPHVGLTPVQAQGAPQRATEGMIIKDVRFVGLENLSEAWVRRVVTTRPGQPFVRAQVEEDVRALLRTRKFLAAFADTAVEDGQAVVVFRLQEKPALNSVEIVGNKRFSDAELYELTPVAGAVLDLYALRRARADIVQKYKQAGYYYAAVELDEATLRNTGRAIYRITEGPRVKVRKIRFEGVRSYGSTRLRMKVETKTYIWLIRTGAFDEEQANRDALALQQFYRDEGYLDARVGYRLDFHDVQREDVDLVFVVEEGPRYRVKNFAFEGNTVFGPERLREVMKLEPGEVLRDQILREDVKRVQDLYGHIGYVDARINTRYDFLEAPGVVSLRYVIDENMQSRFGRITIRGNVRTKDEVIRRELRFYPGELYDTVETRAAEQRVRDTGLFRMESVQITPLEDVDGYREALVQVVEGDHVQFLVGFGISTDNGLIGSISIDNRNFDLLDWPKSPKEFFSGQSFRGDGQRLLFEAQPGTQVSRFRISFTEPYLFDKRVRFDTSLYLFQRGREGYDEERLGFTLSLSKRFEGGILDGWAIEGSTRFEAIDISNLDNFPAREIREAKGSHGLTAVRGAIVRDTTDSRLLPTEGYRLSFSWEQVGALGGDHTFSKPGVGFSWYKTLRTDLLDRKSVLAMRADAAYISGEAPVFETFYGGGFGSIRGFSFRGVSPRGGIYDNPVGGDFILLTGAEYSFPLYGRNFRGVTFLDMGTVEEDFEITSWRAAVGFGFRVQVDFFGPVPLVFDFGFPIAQDEDDDTRLFNFAFGASF